jgi:hypothetical protein
MTLPSAAVAPSTQLDGLRITAQRRVAAQSRDLMLLALDLERYSQIEPRLRSARWQPGVQPPGVGARAEVHAEVSFGLSIVRLLVGDPVGEIVIREWVPDRRIRCSVEATRFTGWIQVDARPVGRGAQITVSGEILLRAMLARRLARNFRAQLEPRMTSAILLALGRATKAIVASPEAPAGN